jgi:hypothetical protein
MEQQAEKATPATRHSAWKLFAGIAALVLLVCAVLLSLLLLIPEGNDYALASRLKQQRLASLPSPKLVLIGGSNLAFGIDSDMLTARTGCPVANMGMNGYLGVRYMLAESEARLQAGDIAVLAFELDSFVKSVEGTSGDLLMIAKAEPASLAHMTWSQVAGVAARIPYVDQQKLRRISQDGFERFYAKLQGKPVPTVAVDINAIESVRGFNEAGDLQSHLDVTWPKQREQGLDISALPLEAELFDLLAAFADRMKRRGVAAIMSYSPVQAEFFRQHERAIRDIHQRLLAVPGLEVPSSPEAFMYDSGAFFDTVYHVNREGRALRTSRLAEDIVTRKSESPTCRTAPQITQDRK